MTEDRSNPEDARDPREEQGEPRFSFTDKRKVDPTDGTARPSGEPGGASGPAEGATADPVDPIDAEAAQLFEQAAAEGTEDGATGDPRVAELEAQVANLAEELKRSQAEYVNSRRRIEAAAEVNAQNAVGRVLSSLIGVLDDVALARQHGDMAEGTPFHSISAKLEDALRTHGMERFGEVGEEFDPTLHEALMHEASEEVEVTTIGTVLQPGYRMQDRILRPARVATRGPQ
ncbi:MAG: nucleotide exchange factor GrpE [Brachybacterium sp.]|nr:nucleotide exchange factor GrpE [Brachybacterium sp.]